ncbi:MAG: hypothetical protein DRP01_09525, partial [Archaeoglobales archaeon]
MTPAEMPSPSVICKRLSEIRGEDLGRRIRFEGIVCGIGPRKGLPVKIEFMCSRCGLHKTIDLKEEMIELIKTYPQMVISFIHARGAIYERIAMRKIEEPCEGEWQHKAAYLVVQEIIPYHHALLWDVVKPGANVDAYNLSATPAFIFTENPLVPGKRYIFEGGIVCDRDGTITLIVDYVREVEHTEEVDEEMLPLIEKFFSFNGYDDVKNAMARSVQTFIQGRELAKLASALIVHSPLYIEIGGIQRRGWLLGALVGDQRTGKGMIGDYWVYEVGVGDKVLGETGRRTGLLYTILPDKEMVRYGTLVLNDRGFVNIQGFHGRYANELREHREALMNGFVKVLGRGIGAAYCRTRLLVDINPARPMEEYPEPMRSLQDTPISNPVDLSRWDIIIPFGG